jgi:hypothetical protein
MTAGNDIVRHVKRLKQCSDASCRATVADELSDVLERSLSRLRQVDADAVRDATSTLMSLAVSESESEARESLLHALVASGSLSSALGERFDPAPLVGALPRLAEGDLEHALYAVGFSRQASALPVLDRFLEHENPHVREVAGQARQELLANGISRATTGKRGT